MNHITGAPCDCEDCRPHALTRNHYFTGKLMCERDFSDEQAYFREKIRLHHQRLHGTGVVCGLRLREATNPSCRNLLVLLEPGSAVDCCGHDIFVLTPEQFDFTKAPAVKALIDKKDTAPHVLEFCLSWRECPTEEVPVLYDECACDDTQCAPNRILESFELEVRVDPPPHPVHLGAPRFAWDASIGIAHASSVVLDEAGQRVFVVAGGDTLYQVETAHLLTEASVPLHRTVQDIALSPDGHTLYVAVAGQAAADPPDFWVLSPDSSGGIAAGAVNTVTLGSTADTLRLAVLPDGRVLAVATTAGTAWLIPAPSASAPVPSAPGALPKPPGSVFPAAAVSSDGTTVWLGQAGTGALTALALPALTATTVAIAGITSADAVALVSSGSGPDLLAVLDRGADKLHLVDPATPGLLASLALGSKPIDILVAPSGGSAVVTTAKGPLMVNLAQLHAHAAGAASPVFALKSVDGRSALTQSARRLFVPFGGDPSGVAVIELSPADCAAALRGEPCPACATADCLVLARVSGWQVGFSLQDPADPPSKPADDEAASVARIDNGARTCLASTQAMTQALLCLMDQAGSGIPGPRGPEGPKGPPGQSAVQQGLTGVTAVSWASNGATLSFSSAGTIALIVAFSNLVHSEDLHAQSAMLLAPVEMNNGTTGWGQVPMAPQAWYLPDTTSFEGGNSVSPGSGPCNAVCLNPSAPNTVPWLQMLEDQDSANAATGVTLRVQLHGDLIRDTLGHALDGNHLPPWVGTPGYRSGDSIEGGLFESWFQISFS
jgi:DNA-binding beta-propeller fold protein YncE